MFPERQREPRLPSTSCSKFKALRNAPCSPRAATPAAEVGRVLGFRDENSGPARASPGPVGSDQGGACQQQPSGEASSTPANYGEHLEPGSPAKYHTHSRAGPVSLMACSRAQLSGPSFPLSPEQRLSRPWLLLSVLRDPRLAGSCCRSSLLAPHFLFQPVAPPSDSGHRDCRPQVLSGRLSDLCLAVSVSSQV